MVANKKQPESERFKNRKQAHTWLESLGYKISKSKFYQDCNDGSPAVAKDGSVSKFQVLTYGQKLASIIQTESSAINTGEDDARKAKADADMAEMKAEKMRREQDKNWLHADVAWATVAGFMGTLRDCVRHHLYTGQGDIILMAGGDQDRSQDVFGLMDEFVDRAFNEVAGDKIDVVFEKIENEDEMRGEMDKNKKIAEMIELIKNTKEDKCRMIAAMGWSEADYLQFLGKKRGELSVLPLGLS